MTASPKRTRRSFKYVFVLAAIAGWLILPGPPSNGASANRLAAPPQKELGSGLDVDRHAALEKLYASFKSGDPFSDEEGKILSKFGRGGAVTELEADMVISRALYDFYIAGRELTPGQEELLDRYSLSVARRVTDVADLKRQLLNKRIAAAEVAPPRTTPLVAPTNDLCSGAIAIPGAGPFPFLTTITPDISDATTGGDPSAPSCQMCTTGVVSRSIWYSFAPAVTATYTISTCADAPTGTTVDDTVMAIYTSGGGCGGPFTELPVACDDDGCVSEEVQSVISNIPLNAGTTYYIVVWMCDNTAPTAGNTAVQLRVSQMLPPANDTCSSPTPLALNTPVVGTTVLALNNYQLSGSACFTGIGQTQSTATGSDVVYSFIAPSAGNYSFKVTGYAAMPNLVLYVATSCPAGSPPITVDSCLAASNRSASSSSEEVACVVLSSGQTVYIFVDEFATTGGSTFRIEATACTLESEPNDTTATAGLNTFGVEGSISSLGEVDFYNLGAPPSGSRVFALVDGVASTSPANFDMRVTTTIDTLEYDDFNNDSLFGSAAPNTAGTPLTGVQSFIRVNHASTTSEPYRLYAIVQPPGANSNCTCSATNEIESNDTPGNASAASNNFFYGSLAGPAPSMDVDFFSFTANTGDLIFLSLDCDPTRNNTPINGALALVAPDSVTTLILVNDGGSTSSTTSGAGSLTATTPNSPGEALTWRATTTGVYYAKVFTTSTTSTGVGDYLLSISRNGQLPTLARFSNEPAGAATAARYENGVSIRWRTQFEIDNLGFNVYREDAGKRIRINEQIIAGSALMVGANTPLGAGGSYSWLDNTQTTANAPYWIESLDLNGESDWHGPIKVDVLADKPASGELERSLTLSELGKAGAQNQTAQIERKAGVGEVNLASLATQESVVRLPAVKLSIKREGLYRVTQPELVAAGFDPRQDLSNLQLSADGQEQPIKVITKSGRFDSSAAIEFYGVGIDSAATDEHVYWLIAGSRPGQRMRQVAAPANPGIQGSFPYTAELKQRMIYFSGLRNGDKENFFGAVVARDPVDQLLTLQHVDAATSNGATLEVSLQGVTPGDHRVEVHLNGLKAGEIVFTGQDEGIVRLPIAQSRLKEGGNIIGLAAMNGSADISLVDYVRVTYWHTFVAANDQLRFTAGHNQAVSVDGFSNSEIRVFDVTDPNAPQEITGAIKVSKMGYSVTVRVTGPGLRTLLAMTNDSANRVANIRLDRPSNWLHAGNAANLIILTRRDFIAAIEPLKTLRQSQGHKVVVVDVEDVYDEFSFGNKTPQALKDFLAYARDNWATAPRYVLLAGDASFDPKNYLGFGDNDLIPTRLIDTQFMETASDDWFADFDGTGLAAMAIGRLPIRSFQEASIEVGKLIGYERGSTPQGAVLVADDGLEFEKPSNELRVLIPDDHPVEQIYRGSLDPSSARERLLDAVNRGPKAINYNGHGNVDSWRGGLLSSQDVNSLNNRDSLSVFMMMTCLNGYFHHAQMESLAESLIKAPNGGAVAIWASTGVTFPSDQGVMSIELFQSLFDPNNRLTLGEMTQRARAATVNRDVRLTWVLLGDPTTRVTR